MGSVITVKQKCCDMTRPFIYLRVHAESKARLSKWRQSVSGGGIWPPAVALPGTRHAHRQHGPGRDPRHNAQRRVQVRHRSRQQMQQVSSDTHGTRHGPAGTRTDVPVCSRQALEAARGRLFECDVAPVSPPSLKKRHALLQAFDLLGAGTRSRTRDLLITNPLNDGLATEHSADLGGAKAFV